MILARNVVCLYAGEDAVGRVPLFARDCHVVTECSDVCGEVGARLSGEKGGGARRREGERGDASVKGEGRVLEGESGAGMMKKDLGLIVCRSMNWNTNVRCHRNEKGSRRE